MSLRYFSAFSGIGGFELAIQQTAPSWRCIGYSEIDRNALLVYTRYFPQHSNYGDILHIDPNRLPDFDLLVGGFPCQPYSQAGRRRGLEDAQGGPVLDALFSLIEAKQPDYLLLENVKGLLSQDKGKAFRSILQRLEDLGYRTEWKILDSQLHGGVPQKRERVYLLGHRTSDHDRHDRHDRTDDDRPFGAGSGGEVFPLTGVRTQDQSLAPGAKSAKSKRGAAISLHVRRMERKKSAKPADPDGEARVETASEPAQRIKRLGLSQRHFFTLTTRPNAALLIGCGDLSRFEPGRLLSEVMDAQMLESLPLRRLTPLEWERLQSFPDGWTDCVGLSDTQRYRCLGNAVTVGVVRTVIRKLSVCVEAKSPLMVTPLVTHG